MGASQDDDTSEKVAGSEFVVGRVAHRNNTSDYLIDSRKQTAKVVVERLKQEGIDLNHNRFLILQVGSPLQCTGQRTGYMATCMTFEQVPRLCKLLSGRFTSLCDAAADAEVSPPVETLAAGRGGADQPHGRTAAAELPI